MVSFHTNQLARLRCRTLRTEDRITVLCTCLGGINGVHDQTSPPWVFTIISRVVLLLPTVTTIICNCLRCYHRIQLFVSRA